MKNTSILLKDTTILNFNFIYKLIKRYFYIILIFIISLVLGGSFYFHNQNVIYESQTGFLNQSDATGGSPTSAIIATLGEKTSGLKTNEVLSIARSVDFQHKIARYIVSNYDVDSLDFRALNSNKERSDSSIFSNCTDAECRAELLSERISNFYQIKFVNGSSNRFELIVRTLSKDTSEKLLKVISNMITTDRKRTLVHFIEEQVKISEGLIKKKKEELDGVNVEKIESDYETALIDLADLNNRTSEYSKLYFKMEQKLRNASHTLAQTNKAIKRDISSGTLERSEKLENLKSRMSNLRSDIASLELSKESLSLKDSSVISSLRNELLRISKEYQGLLRKGRGVGSLSRFIDSQDESKSINEFKFKVIKNQFSQIEEEYIQLLAEKDNAFLEKNSLEGKLNDLKPSIEYLKLLVDKMVKLKLASSTVISDLTFDTYRGGVKSFKKYSFNKVFIFTLFCALGLSFMVIITLYAFDDRIYEDEELLSNFDDLEILGHTPEFK